MSDSQAINNHPVFYTGEYCEICLSIATPERVWEHFDMQRKVFKVLAIPIIAASARAWQLYFKADGEENQKNAAFKQILYFTKFSNPQRHFLTKVRDITERMLRAEFDIAWRALAQIFDRCKWFYNEQRQTFEETLGEVQEIYNALKDGRHFSERFVKDLIDSWAIWNCESEEK